MNMLRYNLRVLLAKREVQTGKKITMGQLAEETGLNRMTLSGLLNNTEKNTKTKTLEILCSYFDCQIGDLVEYIREEPESDS